MVKSIRKAFREEVTEEEGGDRIFIKATREETWKDNFTRGGPQHEALVILKENLSHWRISYSKDCIASARGLLLAYSRHKLFEYGGSTEHWVHSLSKEWYLCQGNLQHPKKHAVKNYCQVKKAFLQEVITTVRCNKFHLNCY